MKSLTPAQTKKLIAFLIEHPDKNQRLSKVIYKIMAETIYKIVRSLEANSKQSWKKDAVELFKSHKL